MTFVKFQPEASAENSLLYRWGAHCSKIKKKIISTLLLLQHPVIPGRGRMICVFSWGPSEQGCSWIHLVEVHTEEMLSYLIMVKRGTTLLTHFYYYGFETPWFCSVPYWGSCWWLLINNLFLPHNCVLSSRQCWSWSQRSVHLFQQRIQREGTGKGCLRWCLVEAVSHILGSLDLVEASTPHHIQTEISEKSLDVLKYHPPGPRLVPSPAPSSLELGDLEGRGTSKVQEEGSFLFGQEGGGDDVVDACWDMVRLHVAEATSGKRERERKRDPSDGKLQWRLKNSNTIRLICRTLHSYGTIIEWRVMDSSVYIHTRYLRNMADLWHILVMLICVNGHSNTYCFVSGLVAVADVCDSTLTYCMWG